MKKTIFVFTFLIFAFASNAQKIIMDKVDKDGSRVISTSEKNLRDFTDKIVTYVHLSCLKVDSLQIWSIGMRYAGTRFDVPKGALLLIKLTNDEVIELKADDKYTYELDYSLNQPYVSAYYIVLLDDLSKIIQFGVKKIRAEFSAEVFDKEWKSDRMGKALKERYYLIYKQIAENPNKSLRSDF